MLQLVQPDEVKGQKQENIVRKMSYYCSFCLYATIGGH